MKILHNLDNRNLGGIQELILNLHKYDRANAHHFWAAPGSMDPYLCEAGMTLWDGGPPEELKQAHYYDVVVGHGVGGWSYNDVADFAHSIGARFVEVMHSNARSQTDPAKVDGFVALNAIALELNRHYPNARKIYGMVPPELFGLREIGVRIGRLSRLAPEKRPDTFAALARAFPGTTFVLAGDGPLYASLFSSAPMNLSLPGTVRDFVGFFSKLGLFVFPTSDECCCISVAMAQAAGVPIICQDIAPLRETTGGYASFVNSDGDWVSRIQLYYDSPETFLFVADTGRTWARDRFHPDVACEKWNALFEEVMG